jgi:hypothetical protein
MVVVARVGVPGGDLDIAKRHPGVEGRHDECSSEHVRVDGAQAGPLPDCSDPPVGCAPVEALAVSPAQDRSLAAFADGEVDGARRAGDEWDGGGLVALAEDAQGAVTAFEAKVLDVGRAGLAYPQPVEPEQHREGRVVAVVLVGGEQEHAEFGAVQTAGIRGRTWGRRTYCAGFDPIRPSM